MTRTETNEPEHELAGSPRGMKRRDFMRLGGALAAATAMQTAGCQMPTEEVVPYNERPEDANLLGKFRLYTTVVGGVPVLARTREGRPILITDHAAHPSPWAASLRTQAAVLDLYDPDRATGPLSVRRGKGAPVETSWKAVSDQLLSHLKARQGKAVLLTGPTSGPVSRQLLDQLEEHAGIRHVSYAPIELDGLARAWQAAFGHARMPRPRLDRAAYVVGFGAEFIDQPEWGLERDFAERHTPDGTAPMSQFVQLEGRLTLTGANADRRIRVRDSQLPAVAAAVAHELVIGKKAGPLAEDEAVTAALQPFAPEAVAKLAGVPAEELRSIAHKLLAEQGQALALGGGSASAGAGGESLELAIIAINVSIGAYDGDVFDDDLLIDLPHGSTERLADLALAMKRGEIGTLIVAGPNPVYDAPPSLGFAEAMSKVGLIVSLADRLDETSAHADWLAPTSHPLEAWGDADLGGGLWAIQQPVIRPLHQTYGLLDVLVTWGARAGLGGAVARAATKAKAPADPAGAGGTHNASAGYHYLRDYFGSHLLRRTPDTPAFESAWSEGLRKGYFRGPAVMPAPRELRTAALRNLTAPQAPKGIELQLYPHFALHDGAAANNGWLLEFADPITRITWDGALSMAPRRFDEMGLQNGDRVEVVTSGAKLTLPAYRHAGMHQDQVAIALGQGRTKAGLVGDGIGQNAFSMRQRAEGSGRPIRAGLAATIRKVKGHQPLALMQGSNVIDRDRRPLVPVTTLSAYQADPKSGTEQPPGGPSAWPGHSYDEQRWQMAIDLSRCNGCGKCTIACQAENNVPVVGADRIREGREMCWIRIDRYYDAPKKEGRRGAEVWDGPLDVVEEPTTLFEPMLCQHCENAPCETVCPFNATMHSADGLNQQIYNRCVGTRYCANNCPFKVRRYNWFEYSFAQSSWIFRTLFPLIKRNAELNTRGKLALKNNPEVTVRSRGVMEKCSFCVQRIREARAEAIRDERPGKIPDGAVVPACMEACPTGAITFGDINDESAKVTALAQSPRAMRLLALTKVEPAISYLTKVRNDKS